MALVTLIWDMAFSVIFSALGIGIVAIMVGILILGTSEMIKTIFPAFYNKHFKNRSRHFTDW